MYDLASSSGAGHEPSAYTGCWLLELQGVAGAPRHAGKYSHCFL